MTTTRTDSYSPEHGGSMTANAAYIVRCVNEREGLLKFVHHVLAMADDAYLQGHPEWHALVQEAAALEDPS